MKLLQTLAILLSVVGAAYAQIPSNIPTNGLQAWFPFNGNANDESGNAHHGSINGATLVQDRYFHLNKAYAYDGVNNTINFGNGVNILNEFTISLWIKTEEDTSLSTFPNIAIILSKEDNLPTTLDWSLGIGANGKVVFKQGCDLSSCSQTQSYFRVDDNRWHQIGIVRKSNGAVDMYLDGGLNAFNTTPQTALTNQATNLISGYCNTPAPQNPVAPTYFKGNIDDIAIWNRALTQNEMMAIRDNYVSSCYWNDVGTYLHGNNIRAYIPNNGGLFFDGQNGSFQVPYNSNASQQTSTIFAGGLWLGGYDSGGNLKMAAQTYNQTGRDYFSGALDDNGAIDTFYDCFYNQVWQVKSNEVLTHLNNFVSSGGTLIQIDSAILYWPGRNNPNYFATIGFNLPANRDFAPFYDYNNDGNYNPFDGDYPVYENGNPNAVASDMTFAIINDNANIHTETNGYPLVVEVHLLTYALNCSNDPILNNTIFTRHSIVSRNPDTLFDVRAALWFDADLGCYLDDYMGTSIGDNAIFFYNGDANDDVICGSNGIVGYGAIPPVQSFKFLNRPLSSTIYYENGNDPVRGNPSSANQYYRLMDGKWLEGSPVSYGGNGYNGFSVTPFPYVYTTPPDSSGVGAWSMASEAISGIDARNLMTTNIDTFLPYSTEHIDVASVYHRDFSHPGLFEMVDLVYSELPQVQNWYDNGFPSSCMYNLPLAVAEMLEEVPSVRVFPNPTQTEFTVEISSSLIGKEYTLYNLLGVRVASGIFTSIQTNLDITAMPSGVYLLQVSDDLSVTKVLKY